MAEEQTPKRRITEKRMKNRSKEFFKNAHKKEPARTQYKPKLQNNKHSYNCHTQTTPYKEKVNPSTYPQTQMSCPYYP